MLANTTNEKRVGTFETILPFEAFFQRFTRYVATGSE